MTGKVIDMESKNMDWKQKYGLKAKIWIESKRTDWKQKYESKAKIEMKSNNIMDVKQ